MKPYPAYKDSGVEWLGQVPEGWEVVPVKARLSVVGGTTPKSDQPAFWDGDIPWITPADLSSLPSRFITETGRQITQLGLDSCGTKIVPENSIVLSTRAPIGSIAITAVPACVNQGCKLLVPKADSDTGYYYYALLSAREQLNLLGRGSTFLELSGDQLAAFRLVFPPFPEQQAIAAFLDRETAKIDGLIEEQRRLIALLAEKRQATISHAVTRGLNPSARLKPSGVDWLGDVPEGWEVVRLKRLIRAIEQGFSPECFAYPAADQEWGVLKAGCVNHGFYNESENKALPPEIDPRPELEVRAGDLLMSRASGSPELIGSVALVRETQGHIMLSDKIFRLNLASGVHKGFVAHSMASLPMRKQIVNAISGGEGMANNLPQREIKNFWFALPPTAEQAEIASYLQNEAVQLDALTEVAIAAITLLQERRTALISAAVTGKIDLREANPASANPPQSMHVSAMVAGVVIAGHWKQAHFGRVKLQKFLYMAQAHAGIGEIGGRFDREAAGPLDRGLQTHVEAALEAADMVRVRQDGGKGSAVRYEFLGDAVALRADLAAVLGERMERFQHLIDRLGSLDTRGIEAVATLYAAWNDLLIEGHTPDSAEIIREVLENWHPEKGKKFRADELRTWLGWMDRQDIVPDGTGPKTHKARLLL